MDSTRDFKLTPVSRIKADPAYAQALLEEALTLLQNGDTATAKRTIELIVNASRDSKVVLEIYTAEMNANTASSVPLCPSCIVLHAEVDRLRKCPICGSNSHNFCTKDMDSLRADKDRFLAALRRIAGELGEFADADGDTMVEKIRFLREDYAEPESKLCMARDALSVGLERLGDNMEHGRVSLTADSDACAKMQSALSNPSPCKHKEETIEACRWLVECSVRPANIEDAMRTIKALLAANRPPHVNERKPAT